MLNKRDGERLTAGKTRRLTILCAAPRRAASLPRLESTTLPRMRRFSFEL